MCSTGLHCELLISELWVAELVSVTRVAKLIVGRRWRMERDYVRTQVADELLVIGGV